MLRGVHPEWLSEILYRAQDETEGLSMTSEFFQRFCEVGISRERVVE